jgi:hypothetical protein
MQDFGNLLDQFPGLSVSSYFSPASTTHQLPFSSAPIMELPLSTSSAINAELWPPSGSISRLLYLQLFFSSLYNPSTPIFFSSRHGTLQNSFSQNFPHAGIFSTSKK